MLPGTSIEVRSEVSMQNITIKPCGGTWKGITVHPASIFMIGNQSSIQGATTCIDLKEESYAEIVSTDIETVSGGTGILASSGPVYLIGNGISGNTITGTFGSFGMFIDHVPYLSVGSSGGEPNAFMRLGEAIHCQRSNVDVVNFTIDDCYSGINAENIGLVNPLTITAPANFSNITTIGVSVLNYELFLSDGYFNQMNNCISSSRPTGPALPVRIRIEDNTISEFYINAILVSRTTVVSSVIKDNKITDNSDVSGNNIRTCIIWGQNPKTNTGRSVIVGNKMFDVAKILPSNSRFTGISMSGRLGCLQSQDTFGKPRCLC